MYFFFTHNKIRALGNKIVLCLVKESRNYKDLRLKKYKD